MPKISKSSIGNPDCKLCYNLQLDNQKLQVENKKLHEQLNSNKQKEKKVYTEEEQKARADKKAKALQDRITKEENNKKLVEENKKLKAELLNRFGVQI
jgi:membrane protein involved in colicin uptake